MGLADQAGEQAPRAFAVAAAWSVRAISASRPPDLRSCDGDEARAKGSTQAMSISRPAVPIMISCVVSGQGTMDTPLCLPPADLTRPGVCAASLPFQHPIQTHGQRGFPGAMTYLAHEGFQKACVGATRSAPASPASARVQDLFDCSSSPAALSHPLCRPAARLDAAKSMPCIEPAGRSSGPGAATLCPRRSWLEVECPFRGTWNPWEHISSARLLLATPHFTFLACRLENQKQKKIPSILCCVWEYRGDGRDPVRHP